MTTVKEIPAKLVAELRAKTGAGMMDCKGALQETGGDLEKAVDILRKKGAAKAEKRAGREASREPTPIYSEYTASAKHPLTVFRQGQHGSRAAPR